MQTEKLQKLIANAGVCSRRHAENLIINGRVRLNGRIALIGDRATMSDKIAVDNKRLRLPSTKQAIRVLLYHKPVGEICSHADEHGRPSIYQKIPSLQRGQWISVGRLDFNTSGVLLLTNNGGVANGLAHPSSMIDREYVVRVNGNPDNTVLTRLMRGVVLEDGPAFFNDIHPARVAEEASNRWFYVVMQSGRNRAVRRLWESQGFTVSRLKRVRFGTICLPSTLSAGRYEELKGSVLADLLSLTTPNDEHEDFAR